MSEHKQMVPLEMHLIDEGRFLLDLNAALLNAQQQLTKHVGIHTHKAKKAKVVVKAEVTLICLDPEQDAYACIAQVKTTLPAAPAAASMLMGGTTQTGEGCLLCKVSGADDTHPAQRKLCTAAGELIDQETGEIEVSDPQATEQQEPE